MILLTLYVESILSNDDQTTCFVDRSSNDDISGWKRNCLRGNISIRNGWTHT